VNISNINEENIWPDKLSLQKTKSKITGDIQFKNVTFAYPSRDEKIILNNFTCIARENEITALVGASGCGKFDDFQ